MRFWQNFFLIPIISKILESLSTKKTQTIPLYFSSLWAKPYDSYGMSHSKWHSTNTVSVLMICAIYKNSIIVIRSGCFEIASRYIYIALTYILYDINSSIVQLCSHIQFIQSGFCVVTPPSDDLHQRGKIQCYVLTVTSICQNKILYYSRRRFRPDHTASHDEVTWPSTWRQWQKQDFFFNKIKIWHEIKWIRGMFREASRGSFRK